MPSQALMIASLIAGSAGMLTYVGLRVVAKAMERGSARREGPATDLSVRMLPILRQIPLPGAVRSRWSTKEVGELLLNAGVPWKAEEFAALRWASLWAGGVMAVAAVRKWDLVGQTMGALVLAAGVAFPQVWLNWRVDRRREEVDISLPNLLDRLALGLEAGLGFEVALRRTVANFPGLLGLELRRLVRQLDRGHSRRQALDELSERMPSDDLRAFVAAVKQAERLGTSLAKALRVQTMLLRARRRRRAQEAGRRLPIIIVFPLVLCFLPALLLIYLAPPLLHVFLRR